MGRDTCITSGCYGVILSSSGFLVSMFFQQGKRLAIRYPQASPMNVLSFGIHLDARQLQRWSRCVSVVSRDTRDPFRRRHTRRCFRENEILMAEVRGDGEYGTRWVDRI